MIDKIIGTALMVGSIGVLIAHEWAEENREQRFIEAARMSGTATPNRSRSVPKAPRSTYSDASYSPRPPVRRASHKKA